MSEEALHRFGKQFTDSDDRCIMEDFVEQSLVRLGFLSEKARGWKEGKPYFLLMRSTLELSSEKSFSDPETLELTSRR